MGELSASSRLAKEAADAMLTSSTRSIGADDDVASQKSGASTSRLVVDAARNSIRFLMGSSSGKNNNGDALSVGSAKSAATAKSTGSSTTRPMSLRKKKQLKKAETASRATTTDDTNNKPPIESVTVVALKDPPLPPPQVVEKSATKPQDVPMTTITTAPDSPQRSLITMDTAMNTPKLAMGQAKRKTGMTESIESIIEDNEEENIDGPENVKRAISFADEVRLDCDNTTDDGSGGGGDFFQAVKRDSRVTREQYAGMNSIDKYLARESHKDGKDCFGCVVL